MRLHSRHASCLTFLFLEVLDEDETIALEEFAKLEQRLAHKDKDEPR
jgi:hypothetical protein